VSTPTSGDVVLVLAAAGTGSRFGNETPKQFLDLAGRSVLRWSLAAFAGQVQRAVIVANPETHERVHALLKDDPPPCPVQVVTGGATRQDSVHCGLRACGPAFAALVHDAARPFVGAPCIAACRQALDHYAGAVVAVRCTATVKRLSEANEPLVAATVPRDSLWLAQTPQGLRLAEALPAFARAEAEGWACSDDVQVLERAGHSVALIPGESANLKITTPDDWLVAKALAAVRLQR
jgi:2-C-methyl-D-erythritol 4-phosphate cytidylyltransferase/2-C-methyl-D-erythritol 2,4-cyclodiphosphate synthase